jgi:hypothetical protein
LQSQEMSGLSGKPAEPPQRVRGPLPAHKKRRTTFVARLD